MPGTMYLIKLEIFSLLVFEEPCVNICSKTHLCTCFVCLCTFKGIFLLSSKFCQFSRGIFLCFHTFPPLCKSNSQRSGYLCLASAGIKDVQYQHLTKTEIIFKGKHFTLSQNIISILTSHELSVINIPCAL